jgi:hypothetical protein
MLLPQGHGAAILCLVAPPWLPQAPEPVMRQATLLAGGGRELPDPLGDRFSANRPLPCPWPTDLPAGPALLEFYRLCNGVVCGWGYN